MPKLNAKIPCLSMLQPWASLLTLGIKRVETRSFKIWRDYRGVMYIHATRIRKKDYDQYYARGATDESFREYVNELYEKIHGKAPKNCEKVDEKSRFGYIIPWKMYKKAFPLGQIIGKVQITDCLEAFDYLEQCRGRHALEVWEREWTLGDLSSDRYAWITRDPENFKTGIPAKGSLGIWDAEPYLLNIH
jgi:hypothetical protein